MTPFVKEGLYLIGFCLLGMAICLWIALNSKPATAVVDWLVLVYLGYNACSVARILARRLK